MVDHGVWQVLVSFSLSRCWKHLYIPASGPGCPGDCAFADVACPGPPADAPCSGVGLCLSPSGACTCWVGYDGADCSLCAEGYMRCARTLHIC